MALAGRFPFCLAFDKAVERGYLSERFALVYAAGCVPVYRSGGDAAAVAPVNDDGHPTYVDARDFALAQFLVALASDAARLARYRAWRAGADARAALAWLRRAHGAEGLRRYLAATDLCSSACRLCAHLVATRATRSAVAERAVHAGDGGRASSTGAGITQSCCIETTFTT